MGGSTSGDYDNLHGSKGRRHRQLDPLHPGQESPYSLGGAATVFHQDDHPSQSHRPKAHILIIGLIMSCQVTLTHESVVVTVLEPITVAIEGMNVNLTCSFTDNQGAGSEEVNGRWKKDIDLVDTGIVTTWDMKTQIGSTTLQLTNVTLEFEGKYLCVVWIRDSLDYNDLKLQVMSLIKDSTRKGDVKVHRKIRAVDVTFPRSQEQENLIVRLIRDFNKVQNVSSITACLPLPQAAGEPIP